MSGAKLLTVADLQERFGVSQAETVRKWAKRYQAYLQPKKIGGKLLFKIEDVENFETNMRVYDED